MTGSRNRFVGRTLSLAVLLALAVSSDLQSASPAPQDSPGKKAKPAEKGAAKAKPKAGSGPEWLTLELGLAQVRQKRLPAIVLYEAPAAEASTEPTGGDVRPAPEGEGSAFFAEHLADSSIKDLLKRFVTIRVTPADLKKPYPAVKAAPEAAPKKGKAQAKAAGKDAAPPPPPGDAAGGEAVAATIGAKLGLGGERSAVIALSYWEEAVLSYVGDLPTKTKAKTELTRVQKVNQLYANEAKRVVPELEKSKYAAKLNNYREAVLKVRDLEEPKAQQLLDPVLKKKVNEVIQDYRAKAQEAMADADKLDAAREYQKAIQAFDKVTVSFPFQDVMQQANKRKGECLRKLTFGV